MGSHHALLLELLLADFLGARRLGGAGDGDLALGEDDLDVARRGHVGVDATVGTVGAATLLGGGIDLCNIDYRTCFIKKGSNLDVINNERVNVETLDLGIGLGVLEHAEQDAARLLGPATL